MRRRLLPWLAPLALLACGVGMRPDADPPAAPAPPRPTVNHALHASRDVLCTDCHDPEETGTPALPKSETCFDCHDQDLAKESERVRAYFDAVRQEDGTYRFSRPEYMGDLVVAHDKHAAAKVDCASCHGAPSEQAFARPAPLALMDTCVDCHEGRPERRVGCDVCHTETRKEIAPATHAAPGFRSVHGRAAPEGWQQGRGDTCGICHEVPQDCSACHQSTMPQTHREASWERFHGKGDLLGNEEPFGETSCALCHTERSCSACHQTEKPRSHTDAWTRRYHGLQVQLDRESCTTCHKQDFCSSCHQSTEPVSHRGNWEDAHCLHCHEPLQANSCFACHKNTLGHLAAPPKPGDAAHAGAADPSGCFGCHTVLPHFDSGGRCGSCHR